jgi:hypothetical protein
MRYSSVFLHIVLGGTIAACSLGSLTPAIAKVYQSSQALPPNVLRQFLADPAALLDRYPNGGAQLITQVRDLAASDPATLKPLLGLLPIANPEQATAIGTALGQVAMMALKVDQAYATRIQEAVVAAQNNAALVAFSAAIGGSIQLSAATGGGGGGGGGGGEEPTGQNQNVVGSFAGGPEQLTTFVANTPDSFPLAFSSGTPVVPGTGGINQPVSPSAAH